ncbi:hypothetical protein K2173_009722 [Erythroxylum novogranatense]|uniref:Phosphatidylinositol-glycan biosynthesis class X protein n=1 Tax=Erythroxylum novogranatense TaxID=1862640 RepID=A0AAV8U4S6_9ROSI|nr:hypothetical protein K2173_009722 [Erythroxylum novogranatense]
MENLQLVQPKICQKVWVLLTCFLWLGCHAQVSSASKIARNKSNLDADNMDMNHLSFEKHIMEHYFQKYETLLESSFQDFIAKELHMDSCKLLPYDALLLRKSIPQRILTGEGSHRVISTTFKFQFRPMPSSQLPSHSCKVIVIERLPSGVFADPFELQHLLQRRVFIEAAVFGDTNLELPSVRSNQSVVEIHMSVGLNIFSGNKNEIEISIDLPLHARYPPLDESGYSIVQFGVPAVFMDCNIGRSSDNQRWLFMPTYGQDESETSQVMWRIPSGRREHDRIVSAVTFLTAFMCTLLIVLASICHSDTTMSETSKQS